MNIIKKIKFLFVFKFLLVFLFVFMLLFSSAAFCAREDFRAYVIEMPDGSVRTHGYNQYSNKTLLQSIVDAGMGDYVLIVDGDEKEQKKIKDDRKYWYLDNNKVKVDNQKKQEDLNKQATHDLKLLNLKAKLNLTDEEFELLKKEEKAQ